MSVQTTVPIPQALLVQLAVGFARLTALRCTLFTDQPPSTQRLYTLLIQVDQLQSQLQAKIQEVTALGKLASGSNKEMADQIQRMQVRQVWSIEAVPWQIILKENKGNSKPDTAHAGVHNLFSALAKYLQTKTRTWRTRNSTCKCDLSHYDGPKVVGVRLSLRRERCCRVG